MTHFLIRYSRSSGHVVLREFSGPASARKAMVARFAAEAARVSRDEEVVVIQAKDEVELRKTHSRYFLSVSDLATAASATSRLQAAAGG